MGIETGLGLLGSVLGALTSLAAGGMLSTESGRALLRFLYKKPRVASPHSARLVSLTVELQRVSREMDAALLQLEPVIRDRRETVSRLESELLELKTREDDLKVSIEHLENVPLAAAEYFKDFLDSVQSRNRKRDYLLFGLGVVASTVIAVVLQLAFR